MTTTRDEIIKALDAIESQLSGVYESKVNNQNSQNSQNSKNSLKNNTEEGKNNDDESKTKLIPLKELFRRADSADVTFMIIGSLGAAITGVSIPLFNVLFGKILDALNAGNNLINSLLLTYLLVNLSNRYV